MTTEASSSYTFHNITRLSASDKCQTLLTSTPPVCDSGDFLLLINSCHDTLDGIIRLSKTKYEGDYVEKITHFSVGFKKVDVLCLYRDY